MAGIARISALKDLGYTDREANFLSLVALHSGYFLRRQFEAFISAPRGRPAGRFLQRAVGARHARSAEYANRTEVFHLCSRQVYRAIGVEDNRNRRPRPNFSIKAKLMALDFVVANRDGRFLGTENEKVRHFCGDLGIDESFLPGKTYSSRRSPEQTRRYFVEKYPILTAPAEINGPARVTSFCYIDEGVLSTSGFNSFLNRYRPLFVALRRFRLIYVAAEYRPFRNAERAFARFAESLARPQSFGPRGAMRRVLRALTPAQKASLPAARQGQAGPASRAFEPIPTFEDRYDVPSVDSRRHKSEQSGPMEAAFEFHPLPRRYDIF